jgi:hypothetical protein
MTDVMTDSDVLSHLSVIEAATCHNDELPGDAKHAARLLLLKTQRDLTLIDAEIMHTSPVLVALLARRARVEEHSNLYQAAIAPHRILPDELLRKIFRQNVLRKLSLPTRKNDLLHYKFPLHWYIIHVCSKWRRIVLEIPKLWNRIAVTYDQKTSLSTHMSTTNLVAEILKRTLDFNFFIFLAIDMSDLEPSDDHDPVSAYLFPNASRLRHLRITASSDA